MVSYEVKYVSKKLTRYVITVFISLLVCFLIPRLAPGDPITALLTRLASSSGQTIEAGSIQGAGIVQYYVKKFGLDKDLFTQFTIYVGNVLQGDLGPSIMAYPRSVSELIADRVPWTIFLLGMTTIISWVLGNVVGAFVGWSKSGTVKAIITSFCLVISEIPFYIFSLLLIYIFVYRVPLFPPTGAKSIYTTAGLNLPYISDVLIHAMLPAMSIITIRMSHAIIHMRAMIQNILGSDFMKFAEVKGLGKRVILMQYAFRNALLPQVTSLAMSIGFMVGGSMIIEWIFSYPGMGQLFVQSISYLDYNVMNGIFLLTIFGVLTANLLIDLLYPLIDPRIRSA